MQSNPKARFSLRNIDRRLVTILLIVFVQMAGAAMILPILPLYAQREFSMSPEVITLLGSSFFAAQFIAGPYLGRLSDKIGRLPVLIVSQIGTALSFALLAVAPNMGLLFAARILDGITGGNIIVAQAYITDITPREKRTESLGYVFAVFGLGFIVGPALGGVLSATLGPRTPYLIAAVAAALTVLLTWLTLDETLSAEQREANRSSTDTSLNPLQLVRNLPLLFVLAIAFFSQFAFGMLQATFALYGEAVLFVGRSVEATNLGVGLLMAAVGVGQVITQTLLLRPLLKRLGEAWLVVLGSFLRTLSFFLFAVITSPWLGAVGSMLFAAGMGLLMPPLQSLATTAAPDELRGGILGVYQSTTSLAIILSTAIAGTVFAIGPTVPYWVGGLLSLILLLPALYFVRWERSHPMNAEGLQNPVPAD